MGTLSYRREDFDFEDRVLAHLQIVVTTKLRRYEPFFLSWVQSDSIGSGRQTLWIDNGVPIHFMYYGSRVPTINTAWVQEMLDSTYRPGGAQIGAEPD